jgi:prophage regulatory protein
MSTELQRFLRLRIVEEVTGLKKSAIYDKIREGEFPRPVPLGDSPNSPVGWLQSEIISWQAARIDRRPTAKAGRPS